MRPTFSPNNHTANFELFFQLAPSLRRRVGQAGRQRQLFRLHGGHAGEGRGEVRGGPDGLQPHPHPGAVQGRGLPIPHRDGDLRHIHQQPGPGGGFARRKTWRKPFRCWELGSNFPSYNSQKLFIILLAKLSVTETPFFCPTGIP